MTGPVAQFNIARLLHDLDDPRISGFVGGLDRVNRMAERSAGFVWRMVDTATPARRLAPPMNDPLVISTLSVWKSVGHLHEFVYRSLHATFYRRKAQWFDHLDGPSNVVWQVAAGHRPTVAEGLDRLQYLAAHGPSEACFDLASYEKIRGAA